MGMSDLLISVEHLVLAVISASAVIIAARIARTTSTIELHVNGRMSRLEREVRELSKNEATDE